MKGSKLFVFAVSVLCGTNGVFGMQRVIEVSEPGGVPSEVMDIISDNAEKLSEAIGHQSIFGYTNSGMERTPLNLVKSISQLSKKIEEEKRNIAHGSGVKSTIGRMINHGDELIHFLKESREIANNDGQEWAIDLRQLIAYRDTILMLQDYEKLIVSAYRAISTGNFDGTTSEEKNNIAEYKALFPNNYNWIITIPADDLNRYITSEQERINWLDEELIKVRGELKKRIGV